MWYDYIIEIREEVDFFFVLIFMKVFKFLVDLIVVSGILFK